MRVCFAPIACENMGVTSALTRQLQNLAGGLLTFPEKAEKPIVRLSDVQSWYSAFTLLCCI